MCEIIPQGRNRPNTNRLEQIAARRALPFRRLHLLPIRNGSNRHGIYPVVPYRQVPAPAKARDTAVQFVTLRGVEGVGAPGRALRSAISTCGKSHADAIRRGATAEPDPKRSSASPGCASGMRPNAVGRQCFHRLCLHQLAPVARQFAQFTQRLRRNEARSDQPGRPESIRII
jgi:hypothetical protein